MNTDPLDPEMIEKMEAWARGEYPGEIDLELREWLVTHYPRAVKLTPKKEYFEAEIAKLKAQGIKVTPELLGEMFPGLEFKFRTRLKGRGDPSVN
jgi:hypothetical protein